jgi:transglutaminase-like putative cysteine protease
MNFEVEHVTTYAYSAPVRLGLHTLRLKPRVGGEQRLLRFSCSIDPSPKSVSEVVDSEGNAMLHASFAEETRHLRIASGFELETTGPSAHDGLATALPVAYADEERRVLAAHWDRGALDPAVAALADELAARTGGDPLRFLDALVQHLQASFGREVRELGPPRAPAETLEREAGSCRDLAVLFLALARQQGFAARFASGYQALPVRRGTRRYMHAWAEVYLPGGGWRGFDPTRGTAVGDTHVVLAAAREPHLAAPIEGSYAGERVASTMEVALRIDAT